jgi:hypothetical protein
VVGTGRVFRLGIADIGLTVLCWEDVSSAEPVWLGLFEAAPLPLFVTLRSKPDAMTININQSFERFMGLSASSYSHLLAGGAVIRIGERGGMLYSSDSC